MRVLPLWATLCEQPLYVCHLADLEHTLTGHSPNDLDNAANIVIFSAKLCVIRLNQQWFYIYTQIARGDHIKLDIGP